MIDHSISEQVPTREQMTSIREFLDFMNAPGHLRCQNVRNEVVELVKSALEKNPQLGQVFSVALMKDILYNEQQFGGTSAHWGIDMYQFSQNVLYPFQDVSELVEQKRASIQEILALFSQTVGAEKNHPLNRAAKVAAFCAARRT